MKELDIRIKEKNQYYSFNSMFDTLYNNNFFVFDSCLKKNYEL